MRDQRNIKDVCLVIEAGSTSETVCPCFKDIIWISVSWVGFNGKCVYETLMIEPTVREGRRKSQFAQ